MTSFKDLAELEQLPLAELEQVNLVCDRFAEAFVRGDSVRIENFVEKVSDDLRSVVALELVRLEVELRLASGEQPVASEYCNRFPHFSDRIDRAVGEITAASNDARHIDTVSLGLDVSDTDHRSIRSSSNLATEWGRAKLGRIHFDPRIGNRLAHYEFRERIGCGGMGVVMRAYDAKLDRDVAIKVLAADLSRDEEARLRFLREAKVAAAVRHPRVVTIHAVDESDGVPYLVMEFVNGQSLEQLIRSQGRFPVQQVVWIGQQIAEGLAAAHHRGLVHRDVKPANVLLENSEGKIADEVLPLDRLLPSTCHVKLTDFGLARAVAGIGLTKTGAIIGTPQYMSPEQAEGEEIDHRSDLFSLGSVMYSMCAGRPAFQGESVPGILRQVADKRPVSLKELGPQIPQWLVAVIDRLMAKRPADRYQTASEVANLLKRRFDEMNPPGDDIHTQSKPASRKPDRRQRLLLGVLPAILVAIAIFVVVTADGEFVLETTDPTIAARLGETGGIVVEDQLTKQTYTLRRGSNRMPSGEHSLLVTTPAGLELETPKLTIRRFGSTSATVRLKPGVENDPNPILPAARTAKGPVTTTNENKSAPASSPTGILLSTDWEWTPPERLAQVNSDDNDTSPSISADGLTLVFASTRGEVRIWQSTRKTPDGPFAEPAPLSEVINSRAEGSEVYFGTPHLSSDGLSLFFSSNRMGGYGGTDLWVSRRPSLDAEWQDPSNLGTGVNTPRLEYTPFVSHDGLSLFWFCPQPNDHKAGDIWTSRRESITDEFGPRKFVRAGVNTPESEQSPSLSADGLTLLFHRGSSDPRLWQATRNSVDDEFGVATQLVLPGEWANLNAHCPTLTADGKTLVFCSNREPGEQGFATGDLWITRRVPKK